MTCRSEGTPRRCRVADGAAAHGETSPGLDSRPIGSLPYQLVLQLRDELGLRRAVETGTYRGGTTRAIAGWFDTVATVELSEQFHRDAQEWLADFRNIDARRGSSPEVLRELHDPAVPTLYWLDAHWSGGDTAGEENPCPVLEELAALQGGHPCDCVLIDDAREFATSADAGAWPSMGELFDATRTAMPSHYVTSIHDLVIAVPESTQRVVDAWARDGYEPLIAAAEQVRLRGFEEDSAARPRLPRALALRLRARLGL